MSDWDKNLINKAFLVLNDNNLYSIILVTTNASGMRIDNPNIKCNDLVTRTIVTGPLVAEPPSRDHTFRVPRLRVHTFCVIKV